LLARALAKAMAMARNGWIVAAAVGCQASRWEYAAHVLLGGKVQVNRTTLFRTKRLGIMRKQCNVKNHSHGEGLSGKKIKIPPAPAEKIFIEAVAQAPASRACRRRVAAGLYRQSSSPQICHCADPRPASLDDIATIIFSRGSTGTPKGYLTHYKHCSTFEQLNRFFSAARQRCIMGILPFFHSFGFTDRKICLTTNNTDRCQYSFTIPRFARNGRASSNSRRSPWRRRRRLF